MSSIRKSKPRLLMTLGFLPIFLFGSPSKAHAEDGFLVFHTFAWHAKNRDERNAVVPGIGWEYSPSKRIGYHVGTLSDSFGYQAFYGGVNLASPRFSMGKTGLRFMIGATVLHKQYHKNSDPETKIVPLPVVELALTRRAVLNISGSPQVDFGDQRNNAVAFFQFKLGF